MALPTMDLGKENQDPNLVTQLKELQLKEELGVTTPSSETNDTNDTTSEPPKDPKLRRRVLPNPLIDDLNPESLKKGVLIPLKTTQEVRQDHTIVQALITRAPTKSANDVLE